MPPVESRESTKFPAGILLHLLPADLGRLPKDQPGDAGRWQQAPSILIGGVLVLVLVLLPHLMPSAPITTHNAASLHLCIKVLL